MSRDLSMSPSQDVQEMLRRLVQQARWPRVEPGLAVGLLVLGVLVGVPTVALLVATRVFGVQAGWAEVLVVFVAMVATFVLVLRFLAPYEERHWKSWLEAAAAALRSSRLHGRPAVVIWTSVAASGVGSTRRSIRYVGLGIWDLAGPSQPLLAFRLPAMVHRRVAKSLRTVVGELARHAPMETWMWFAAAFEKGELVRFDPIDPASKPLSFEIRSNWPEDNLRLLRQALRAVPGPAQNRSEPEDQLQKVRQVLKISPGSTQEGDGRE